MDDYYCQVSLTQNGIMVNIRGDTDDDVAKRVPAWIERLKSYNKPEAKQETRQETKMEVPGADKIEIGNNCQHTSKEDFGGVSEFGPWKAEKCLDCGMVRFEGKKKAGGTFWKNWEVSKK